VYGTKAAIPGPDNVDRGLLFLAMNADFEQQFEFISQNWVNNDAFDGLERERDPLVGDVDARGVFSVPGFPLRTRFRGLPRFVHVRGGEYFFLPGLRALRTIAGLPVKG
jgi:deferrochelatase/peroxidase EfeB